MIASVWRLACVMYPDWSVRSMKKRLGLTLRALADADALRPCFEVEDNPALAAALERFPLIRGAIDWPYLHRDWSRERRWQAIDTHYRLLDGRAAILAQAPLGGVELASLGDELPGLRIVLDKTNWFAREGEAVLNLFLNDQRLFSTAFTLGVEDGERVLYVGAVQGANLDHALDVYRGVTRAAHGMRPRDLLLNALKMLCAEARVAEIWGISNACRQHRSRYYGDAHEDKIHVDYDEIWREHGGVAMDNGFCRVAAAVTRRPVDGIPSRKRAAYRRRYQMLDRIAGDIRFVCDRYAAVVPSEMQRVAAHEPCHARST